jgi:hypothetical protein
MKIKHFYIIISLCAIAFISMTAFFSRVAIDEEIGGNKSLINFSHSFHSDLAECADCHSSVMESFSLNDRLLPDHDDCANCHEVDDDEECSTCHSNGVFEPLIQTKSELIFSHKDHLGDELDCAKCHKDFTSIDYSDEADQKIPPMKLCVSCHSPEEMAPNFCESCHISTVNLIPQNHVTDNFIRGHKFLAQSFDANCMMCHDNSTCDECHISTTTITENNTPDDFYQPYMPSQGIDGTRQQVIERVHELNYRYIHGIDANSKVTECQTCHQIESFCANCHTSELGDFSLGGVAPLSHIGPNFKTIGVGSGGGEHAILARRDLESCTACHDVQGADPSCIICHLDSDGIQGTNPKTHVSNFMRNEQGDWHESEGSICYNCHTSASPSSRKTDGFCNYCHGL